jgi:hypothetical protein
LKRRLLLIPLLFVLLPSARAQFPPNVVLTGRVSDTYRENFNDYVIWKANLSLEFTNHGNRPVILLNPTLSFGTGQKELVFFFKGPFLDATAKENEGFTAKSRSTIDAADTVSQLAKQLDVSSPPDNLVVILKPGESLPFSDSLVIKQLYFHNVPVPIFGNGNKWDGTMVDGSCLRYLGRSETGCPLNFASSLTIKYEFDLSQYKENPALLSQLKTRWRDYGEIPLNGESSVIFTSQPVSIYPMEWVTLVDPTIWDWAQPAQYDPNPIVNFSH